MLNPSSHAPIAEISQTAFGTPEDIAEEAMPVLANDQDFERQLKDDFLVEASELLGQTETLFLQLEQQPANTSLIDKIFRIVHTIKGSGGVAGFNELTVFAHSFETLLGKIRTQEVAASQAVIDDLLAGVDVLNQFIRSLKKDHNAVVDTKAVTALIEAYINPDVNAAKVSNGDRNDHDGTNAASPTSAPPTATPPATTQTKRRILLISNDQTTRDTILAMLGSKLYEIITVADSVETIATLNSNSTADVAVIDLPLKNCDCSAVTEQCRQLSQHLPIIALFGETRSDEISKLVDLGLFAFFEKPTLDEKFSLSVEKALELKDLRTTMTELANLSVRSYMTFRRILEVVETESLTASSHPAIQKYSKFLEDTGMVINRALMSSKT